MSDPLRIVVLGYITRFPLGGMAWHYLQYVLGFRALGHHVTYLEDSDDHDKSCYDPIRHVNDTDPTYGLRFTKRVFDRLEIGDIWAYYDAHTSTWHGPVANRAVSLCSEADVLVNVSGANPMRPWLEQVPLRIMIDTDPAFEQIRQLTVPNRASLVRAHNAFFTFGVNYRMPGCEIPDDGLAWKPTRQPVVIEHWAARASRPEARFTTIMQWDSYPTREYEGKEFGMKSLSFDQFRSLPNLVDVELEIALGSPNAPRSELQEAGWLVRDPFEVTRDPWVYQAYIGGSKAEFSVAKHGYVVSRSGWFSERSANYLASGRPVVVQETGFSDWMDTGLGVVPFSDLESAAAAIEDVEAAYAAHSDAAREIAREHFESRRVLSELTQLAEVHV